ncbi:uncharacterized protein [Hoplias malabaricus]|uniref:uncharacterized protein n=1 Tax=Hoplias malabaricus TaxID=27720 RepID=UPI0034623F86
MGKIQGLTGRKKSATKPYSRNEEGFLLPPLTPSVQRTDLSVSGQSVVSAPAVSNSTCRDVYINIEHQVPGTPSKTPVNDPDNSWIQPSADRDFLKNIFQTPKQTGLALHGGSNRAGTSRCRLTYNPREDPVQHTEKDINLEDVDLPGEQELSSTTGEVTGTRVTPTYICSECDTEIRSFKPKQFSVKCSRCKHQWRCDKIKCTCAAEIIFEKSDGTVESVVLGDSLLRSIISFKTQGYCDIKEIQDTILKLGIIRVDHVGGRPKSVTCKD